MAKAERKLTIKQENFCFEYVKSGNASDAYRKAGYAKTMSEKTVNEASSRLMKNSKVVARIESLRKPVIERAKATLQDILDELDENRKVALTAETPQAAAATAATMGKAKLLGYMVDKTEVKHGGVLTAAAILLMPPDEAYKRLLEGNDG